MKEILTVIGLFLELIGVILMAMSNVSRAKLKCFPLVQTPSSKFFAYSMSAFSIICAIIFGCYFSNNEFWPWLLWVLTIIVIIFCLPVLVIYAIPYSRDIGQQHDNEKKYWLNMQGLLILAVGFIMQTLGASLST